MQAITSACPRLQLLMLGGCSIPGTTATTLGLMHQLQLDTKQAGHPLLSAATAAVQAVAAAAPESELALVDRVQAFAVQLCLSAAALPQLYAAEVTFMPRGVAAAVRSFLHAQVCLPPQPDVPPQRLPHRLLCRCCTDCAGE